METKYYKDATDFLSHTSKYLTKDEARYGLMMGIAKALVEHPERFSQIVPWFCTIGSGEEIYAAVIRTPPHNVLVAHFSGDINVITEKLIGVVFKQYKTIPGVVGDKELADIFARRWCRKSNVRIVHTMAQRIFRLVKVNDVPISPGKMRAATMADKELVVKWAHAFHIDIGGLESNIPEADITPVLELGWVFLWEYGRPVSMALKTRPTDKGMTVGGVYTPPELRGKGYATSCVAELSRNILKSGKEFCMLYTDLANPTSNSIYKKIGYKEVCDSVQYTFEMAET